MKILVSVVIPAYNVGLYLADCLKSIQHQSYKEWEAIIVNDGSIDDTAEIAALFAKEDARIKLISQKNAGVSAARNTGLRAAQGQYVTFLDGDDLWETEFLAETTAAVLRTGADVAYSGYNRLYSNGYQRKYRYKYPSGYLIIPPIEEPVRFHIGAMLIDKELLNRHNIMFTEGCLVGQDWEMIAKVLTVAKVQSVPRNLMIYRQRKGSTLNSNWNWRRHIHALWGYKRAIDFMAKELVDNDKKVAILQYHKRKLGRQSYRFLWRMVKKGAHQEALKLLSDEEFSDSLRYVSFAQLGLMETLKYKIVAMQNRFIWEIVKCVVNLSL